MNDKLARLNPIVPAFGSGKLMIGPNERARSQYPGVGGGSIGGGWGGGRWS